MDGLYESYVQAVVREIQMCRAAGEARGRTLYVGGGTPSVLGLDQIESILMAVRRAFDLLSEAEVTVEANPGTIAPEYLQGLRDLRFNRLSLGVQSFADGFLGTLGRLHSSDEAVEAYYDAREAGFSNINLDLIYGLPGQGLQHWEGDLLQAVALKPEHLSLYALALVGDAPLALRIARGEVPPLDEDLAADMYVLAEEILAGAGYEHYELSNWARDGGKGVLTELPVFASQHNLSYWENGAYLGFGAGAHRHYGGRRCSNVPDPEEYVRRLEAGKSPLAEWEDISPSLERAETMILGLRLLRGIEEVGFRRRFGESFWELYGREIEGPLSLGLLEMAEGWLRLTPKGRLLGNEVFQRFLPRPA
jgi:oxygen-independent coproporphyrinogen-3 oxidase